MTEDLSRYSMLLDCFRGMYKTERERVLRDNRARKIRLKEELDSITVSLKLLEEEHVLCLLKESKAT